MYRAETDGIVVRRGRVTRLREQRPGARLWEIEIDGEAAEAWSFDAFGPSPSPGKDVLVNTTAVRLDLGSGGAHFILPGVTDVCAFSGREAGHQLRLRYTPLQHRVMSVEDEASPWRTVMEQAEDLQGMPVLAVELHSAATVVAIAAQFERPGLRIAMILLDTAALPAPLSRALALLREREVAAGAITCGNAWGGDLEAANIYTGLLAARHVMRAGLAIVTQGPGAAGAGTRYGWGGLGLVDALHAAAHLQGRPLLAPRMSSGDPRPRHRGLSHHTITQLHCLRAPVSVPVPSEVAVSDLQSLVDACAGSHCRHTVETVLPGESLVPLDDWRPVIGTMGRTIEDDSLFYSAAAAAGRFAAGWALDDE